MHVVLCCAFLALYGIGIVCFTHPKIKIVCFILLCAFLAFQAQFLLHDNYCYLMHQKH